MTKYLTFSIPVMNLSSLHWVFSSVNFYGDSTTRYCFKNTVGNAGAVVGDYWRSPGNWWMFFRFQKLEYKDIISIHRHFSLLYIRLHINYEFRILKLKNVWVLKSQLPFCDVYYENETINSYRFTHEFHFHIASLRSYKRWEGIIVYKSLKQKSIRVEFIYFLLVFIYLFLTWLQIKAQWWNEYIDAKHGCYGQYIRWWLESA